MKRILSTCSLFLFVFGSMNFGATSYAASKESGAVSFPDAVRVGTNTLPAGTYSVHWQSGSGDVQVTPTGHGHEVSVPATVAPSVGSAQVLMHRGQR
jgi:hypothetical protein